MSDYIDREAAYEVLTEYYHHSTEFQHLALKDALARVPAADVREVKRGEKTILDVTCGDRTIWFQKNEPHTLYCDKRREEWICDSKVKRHLRIDPNVICDFTSLPFDDDSFSLVVFDPPHVENLAESSWLRKEYGSLDGDWKPMIRKGFEECMRVLKPDGVLVFKWSDISISTREILNVIGQEPLFGHRSGKKMNTHWMCFMKFEDCPNCGAKMESAE